MQITILFYLEASLVWLKVGVSKSLLNFLDASIYKKPSHIAARGRI